MRSSVILFIGSFVFYTILSWILLFRQEQTLAVIGNFYPSIAPILFSIREILLHLGLNSLATVALFLVLIVSFWKYILLLRQKLNKKTVLFIVLIIQIIVLFSYPVLSTDIFDYILTGRLGVVHGQNIWSVAPSEYLSDPFYHLANWQDQISPYGVVNKIVYDFAAIFSGNDLLQSIIVHKLLVFVFVLLSIIVVGKMSNFALLLIFANPLFVIETAGSAHNIILTLFLMLLSYLLYKKGGYFLVGVILALAVHTKFLPIFLAVFMVIDLFSKRRFRDIFVLFCPFLILNLIFFNIVGTGAINYLLTILVGKPIYWQSLPQLFQRVIPMSNFIFTGGFLLFFLWQIRQGIKGKNPIVLFCETVLFYLLFCASFYLNWYVLWIFIFVPFIPWGKLAKTIMVFSITSGLAYPLYMFSLRLNHTNPIWLIVIYVFISGMPAVYYLVYDKFFAQA